MAANLQIQRVASGEPRQEAAVEVERGGGEDDAESCSIYVKNLAWATEDRGLARHFDGTVSAAGGSIRSANHPNPGGKGWVGHASCGPSGLQIIPTPGERGGWVIPAVVALMEELGGFVAIMLHIPF